LLILLILVTSCKDNYNTDDITCYNTPNCTLIINFSYFIIIGRDTNISEITNNSIYYFYVDDTMIGNSLMSNDNITFFNMSSSVSFSWNSSEVDKSWQFYNEGWQKCKPTPGQENNCMQNNLVCIQNWSCSEWGSCLNEIQTRSCVDLNNCSNVTGKPIESQTCNTSSSPMIYLGLNFPDEVENSEEFDVTLHANNLEDSYYDVKIFIYTDQTSSVISEIYDESIGKWKNAYYYIDKTIRGEGDEKGEFSLRLKEDYHNFNGKANISARLRKSGTSQAWEFFSTIKIIEPKENTNTTDEGPIILEAGEVKKLENEEAIKLSSPKDIRTGGEKKEYIKKYAIYFYALFSTALLVLLIVKIRRHEK